MKARTLWNTFKYLLAFGLLLLVLFLTLRLLLLLLWLRFLLLLLRFRLLLLCRLCLFFLFVRFGFFLLRSRLSLFLVLCWLSALVMMLFLCERRKIRSEKQKQGACADESEYSHVASITANSCVTFVAGHKYFQNKHAIFLLGDIRTRSESQRPTCRMQPSAPLTGGGSFS